MKALFLTHYISVVLFLVIYLVKTILLLTNNDVKLANMTRVTKVPEMIVSFLFLVTGVWMFVEIGAIKNMQIIKLVAVFLSIPLAVIGFKRKNKALAVISMLLIIAAFGLAEMSRKKPYPTDNTPSAASNGMEIYKEQCQMCHGESGSAGISGATDLSKSALSRDEAIGVITNGRNGMQPYGAKLTTEQINAVADHIQTLKK